MRRRLFTLALSVLGLLLLAAIAAPFIKAGRFTHLVQDGLERSLHRKVRIQDARFSLWRGPAFSIENVLIEDDASAGI